MNLQKCENGHFYDADKYKTCPHCQQADDDVRTIGRMENAADFAPAQPGFPNSLPPTAPAAPFVPSDDAKTVGILNRNLGVQPVAGWLVCIKGTAFGQSYVLHEGKNFIGRGADMDVVLSGDNAVSRNRHACVIYEPRVNVFYAQPGESHELFYLNNNVVLNSEVLKAWDVLLLGETELLFVPLCGPEFNWEMAKSRG